MGSRFSGELILDILGQARSGVSIQELCKQYDLCEASFYHFRANYDGGASLPESKRTSCPEAESAELRRLLGSQSSSVRAAFADAAQGPKGRAARNVNRRVDRLAAPAPTAYRAA